MRKTLCLFLITVLLLGFSSITYAHDPDIVIEPREIGPCSVYGIHKMVVQPSWANVYDNQWELNNPPYWYEYIATGGVYQCDCGEVVVCEGRPHLGHPLGKYFYGSDLIYIRGVDVCQVGSIFYWSQSEPLVEDDYNTLPGYRFLAY